jgi:valyl-tRNA synthetase
LESIHQLANVRLDLHHGEPPKFEGAVRSTPDFDLVLEMPRAEGQQEKLLKENEQLEKLIANQERQLSNEDFIAKAPNHIVAGMRQKLAEYKAQLRKNLDALGDY